MMRLTKAQILLGLAALMLILVIVSILRMEVTLPENIDSQTSADEIAAAQKSAPTSIEFAPDKQQFSYIRVNLSPYFYQNGRNEWEQIRLYTDDPDDAETIQWILEEFQGSFDFAKVLPHNPGASGDFWDSLLFYDDNDKLVKQISWREVQYDAIYLTPNPNSPLTLLYENDIDWDSFYAMFEEYKL